MKESEKIEILRDKHFSSWLMTRKKVKDEVSDSQTMFCVCGKLATGLHEETCRKFNKKINSETVKRLAHLLSASGQTAA